MLWRDERCDHNLIIIFIFNKVLKASEGLAKVVGDQLAAQGPIEI